MPVTNRPPDRSPVPGANAPGSTHSPPDRARDAHKQDLYVAAAEAALPAGARREGDEDEAETLGAKMLRLVREAESSAETFANFTRRSWQRAYNAFHNKHFSDSKYNSKDYAARSKIFRPKTRSAVRKAMAATAASMFSTTDAIAIQPGNEGDPNSRAGAALMQEVINYRTDRTSGRNAIPWFKTAMGAVMDATLTGICVSKQYWKLETKEVGEQPVVETDPATGEQFEVWEEDPETGETRPAMAPVLRAIFDRPDCLGLPPENVLIDSGADWTDPAQSAAFLILKWPMKIEAIRQREADPRDPWKHYEDSILRASSVSDRGTGQSQGIRNARTGGTDPHDKNNQTDEFTTVWVYEAYVRCEGEDYTFFSLGHQHLLSDPKPVEEKYPWNDGERPIVIGYGSLEAHKIFPMAPAESWQQLQSEINDLANLTLDSVKLSIAPVAKVVRGRHVELDKLARRAPGTNILMSALTDVEFDKPPGVDTGAWAQQERLNNDFDGLAGQFDQSSVMGNRQLNETVGGMKLLSGAANALQEFDQRVFFETWAEPVLGQLVRLCQYYEHDETVLALCGERAKLWEKHGVNEITDAMIDAQVTIRIDIGVGAGDPQQRLAKFQMASSAAGALLQGHPKFVSGELELDAEAIIQECYGAAGYRDGGKRFVKKNPPKEPDPMAAAELAEKQAGTAQKRSAATLNDAKAMATATESRLHVMELIADLFGQRADRERQEIERADGLQARAEDRSDAKEARREEHQLARETAAAKGEGGAKPRPKPKPAAEPQDEAPRQQQVQLIRGPDGMVAGARITRDGQTRLVKFERGRDGRIANFQVVDGGGQQPSPIELPPPNLRALARPQSGGMLPMPGGN